MHTLSARTFDKICPDTSIGENDDKRESDLDSYLLDAGKAKT